MRLRRILFFIALAAALVCLSGGFGIAGLWIEAGLVLIPILGMLSANRFSAGWLPSACLVSLVAISAAGLVQGVQPLLMIFGSSAALAGWDLVNLEKSLRGNLDPSRFDRFEQKHVRYLTAAIGLGVCAAAASSAIPFQLPFIVILLLVISILFSLDRVTRYLNKKG